MIEFIEFLQGELLLTGTLLALIVLLIVNIYGDKFKKYEVVDTNGAITLMDDDLIIIDVREEKERSSGFIKSDIHIPMAQVKAKLDSLDKSKKILTYCRTGSRSNRISELLCRNQFENVYCLKGGFDAWQKAGLPITK